MRLGNGRIVLAVNGNRNILRAFLISRIKRSGYHTATFRRVHRVFRSRASIHPPTFHVGVCRFTSSMGCVLASLLKQGGLLGPIQGRSSAGLIVVLGNERYRYDNGFHRRVLLRLLCHARLRAAKGVCRRRRYRFTLLLGRLSMELIRTNNRVPIGITCIVTGLVLTRLKRYRASALRNEIVLPNGSVIKRSTHLCLGLASFLRGFYYFR